MDISGKQVSPRPIFFILATSQGAVRAGCVQAPWALRFLN